MLLLLWGLTLAVVVHAGTATAWPQVSPSRQPHSGPSSTRGGGRPPSSCATSGAQAALGPAALAGTHGQADWEGGWQDDTLLAV